MLGFALDPDMNVLNPAFGPAWFLTGLVWLDRCCCFVLRKELPHPHEFAFPDPLHNSVWHREQDVAHEEPGRCRVPRLVCWGCECSHGLALCCFPMLVSWLSPELHTSNPALHGETEPHCL